MFRLVNQAPGAGEGLAQFKKGFLKFKQEVISAHPEHFRDLASAQSPKVMVIACCDSRVDPALLMGAGPGDIFIVRCVVLVAYAPFSGFLLTYRGHIGTSPTWCRRLSARARTTALARPWSTRCAR